MSAIPAIFALIIACITSFILAKKFGEPPILGRFSSIDGLRGFLAFFVFLHHSCIWYFYLQNGKWEIPPSNLYTHFGQSSVALFFMITGFLFFTKILNGKIKKIEWGKLYVGRFIRLAPLYFLSIFSLLIIVLILSNGNLNENINVLTLEIIRWLGFTIFGGPNINGIENTNLILAGVTWSLPFEWIFYFSLPLLALTTRLVPPAMYFCLSAVGVILIVRHPDSKYLIFFGGMIAAVIVKSEWVCKVAPHRFLSFIAIIFLFSAVFFFRSAYELMPIILLTCFFIIIASGNSIFGLLSNPTSRTLGEFAYGIYLLHGIILFITFNFILGLSFSRSLSAMTYWCVVVGITPALIITCFLAYKFIEFPAMQKTQSVTDWLGYFYIRTRTKLSGKRQSSERSPEQYRGVVTNNVEELQ